MPNMFWFALAIVAVASLFLWLAMVRPFLRSRREAIARLCSGSRLQDTSVGPIEYKAIGEGPAVLLLHGGAGGWDQGVVLGVDLLAGMSEGPSPDAQAIDYDSVLSALDSDSADSENSAVSSVPFSIIAPSRSGYVRTPLTIGRTPAQCADAMACLLDELEVERVVVVGVSGGGPTAIEFALRHRSRTSALVLVAAITKRHEQLSRTAESVFGRVLFSRRARWMSEFGGWLLLIVAGRYPAWFLTKLLGATELFRPDRIALRVREIIAKPQQVRWVQQLMRSMFPLSMRKEGLSNDLAQFAVLPEYPVKQIDCPTLVVHGRFDGNVPFDHAEFAAYNIPGAELCVVENCGHLIWLSDQVDEVRSTISKFLATHAR